MPSQRNYSNWLLAWKSQFDNTEVPGAYAIWTGMWAIASALRDNVWLARGHSQLFPHIYLFLVGPSGGGKSYAADVAMDFLREIPTVNIHAGDMSKSFLITYLEGIAQAAAVTAPPSATIHPSMALFSDELAHTIASGERASEFLRGMTQLYNSGIDSGTHTHQMRHTARPVISWLALATIRWLKLSIPPDMVDSGFVARVITIIESLSPAIVPELPPDDLDKTSKLIADLGAISQLSGQFQLSTKAKEFHTEWYTATRKQRLALKDEVSISIYGRDDEHAMKVAMILSASQSDSLLITADTLRNATELVQRARRSNVELYRSLATGNNFIALKYYLLEKIYASPGAVGRTALLRSTSSTVRNSKLFDEVIKSLIEEEFIEAFFVGRTLFLQPLKRKGDVGGS